MALKKKLIFPNYFSPSTKKATSSAPGLRSVQSSLPCRGCELDGEGESGKVRAEKERAKLG